MNYEIKRLIKNSNLPSKAIPIVSRLFNQMDSVQAGDSCLALSVSMCVAFTYIGIDSDVKLGQVVVAGETFYHSWLELYGKIVDIAIYGNTKYSDVYKELSHNKNISVLPQINKSYQEVDNSLKYYPDKFDDDFKFSQLNFAYNMPILNYCDSAPNNGMWASILRALQISGSSQHMEQLRRGVGNKRIGV